MSALNDLVEKYKKVPFAKGLLPFIPALDALNTPFSKICAKPDGKQRWVICDKLSGEPTLFSHAAVYSEGYPPETGNYVPGDKEIPAGLEFKAVQRRPNSRCVYTYGFDTYTDISLYEGQWALDAYMAKVEGFNPGNLPRRPYLSGKEEKYRSRFWMQTPMFIWKAVDAERPPALTYLHPWVLEAEKRSKGFRANPDRPRVWMRDGDATVPVEDREYGPLQRGDIVALSFTVTYHITRSNWFPQFHPADIVVLQMTEGDPTDYSAPMIDLYSRPPPTWVIGDAASISGPSCLGSASGGEVSQSAETVIVKDDASGSGGTGQRDAQGEIPADVILKVNVGSPLTREGSLETLGSDLGDGVAETGKEVAFAVVDDLVGGGGHDEIEDVGGKEDKALASATVGKSGRSVRKRA